MAGVIDLATIDFRRRSELPTHGPDFNADYNLDFRAAEPEDEDE